MEELYEEDYDVPESDSLKNMVVNAVDQSQNERLAKLEVEIRHTKTEVKENRLALSRYKEAMRILHHNLQEDDIKPLKKESMRRNIILAIGVWLSAAFVGGSVAWGVWTYLDKGLKWL